MLASFCKLADHPGDIGTSAECPCGVAATLARHRYASRSGRAGHRDMAAGEPKPADKPGPDVREAIKPMDFQKLLDLIEALKK